MSAALLLAALLATGAPTHPFHETVAEAEYDPATGLLEVALRVDAQVLEETLTLRALRRVSLDDVAAAEPHVIELLRRDVSVRTADGETRLPQLIGLEPLLRHAWLYFEIPLPDGLHGVHLRQALFTDREPEQVNLVHLRQDAFRTTLRLTAAQPAATVLLPGSHLGPSRTRARARLTRARQAGDARELARATVRAAELAMHAGDLAATARHLTALDSAWPEATRARVLRTAAHLAHARGRPTIAVSLLAACQDDPAQLPAPAWLRDTREQLGAEAVNAALEAGRRSAPGAWRTWLSEAATHTGP